MVVDFLRDCKRIIRLKNLEAWDITVNSKSCRIIIIDKNRPSEDSDYPWILNGIGEDRRKNHITVNVIAMSKLSNDEENLLYQVSEHLIEHVALAHCNVSVLFKVKDPEQSLDEFLAENVNLNYREIPFDKFIHFSQD
ncbi:hypothetical protein JJQ72_18575 [Paenibacillus sp. F411]|uniref:hypothetical protein n=1 Tax=Paenibacillus sp. F411 TaxID=2820239 RepID=UPI001AAE4F8B|nr:hypothetical protein [Paenibacillus sp. F411]MBO2945988.1 hypothetical protein [Paenibacillus sp. F411]